MVQCEYKCVNCYCSKSLPMKEKKIYTSFKKMFLARKCQDSWRVNYAVKKVSRIIEGKSRNIDCTSVTGFKFCHIFYIVLYKL